jgi:hypothetical protein
MCFQLECSVPKLISAINFCSITDFIRPITTSSVLSNERAEAALQRVRTIMFSQLLDIGGSAEYLAELSRVPANLIFAIPDV